MTKVCESYRYFPGETSSIFLVTIPLLMRAIQLLTVFGLACVSSTQGMLASVVLLDGSCFPVDIHYFGKDRPKHNHGEGLRAPMLQHQ